MLRRWEPRRAVSCSVWLCPKLTPARGWTNSSVGCGALPADFNVYWRAATTTLATKILSTSPFVGGSGDGASCLAPGPRTGAIILLSEKMGEGRRECPLIHTRN